MDKKLPPIIHQDVSALLADDTKELYTLTELLGSPLHLTFPQMVEETAKQFKEVLNDAGMQGGRVHFAAKANKADAFMAASAAAAIHVDASSAQEFTAALSAGVPGSSIGVSGPAKPPALIALAIQHGASIAIDDTDELETISKLAKKLAAKEPVRVSLRIASSDDSRFGMTDDAIKAMCKKLRDLSDRMRLEGFSFHVAGYETNDRVEMIIKACEYIEYAYELGLKPNHINIGGGLQVTYASKKEWSHDAAINRAFAGNVAPQFVYPYTNTPAGPEQLKVILAGAKEAIQQTESATGSKIVIDLEPGRSLLDQAGITVFRVRGVKPIGKKWLVMVDGNSRSLAEFWRNSEFFLDPVLLSTHIGQGEPFAAAIASNTCLESDYLARRFVPFDRRPEPNDLLVYINTAGYQMDSKESEFHRLPTPHKVAAIKRADGWHFVEDKHINVVDLLEGQN